MGDLSTVGGQSNSDMIDLTGKITVVAVIMVFLVIVFVFLLHVYAKWFWRRLEESSSNSNPATPRRRLDFASNQELAALRKGIDPSVLKSIPVVIFNTKDFKNGLECSICLCDVSEGEKTRFLPICNHGFHVECIDMWFQSHSSCPICRNLVSKDPNLSDESTLESVLESSSSSSPQLQNHENNTTSDSPTNFPTNVLFWGNDVEVRTLGNYMEEGGQQVHQQEDVSLPSTSFPSSSARSNSNRIDGVLVVDIPQQVNEDDEAKSPPPTRFRSVKRLMGRESRRVGPCNPGDFDVEQATRS